MADTFTTKLGNTSKAGERTRIWIEGARLIKAGFTPGTTFERHWHEHEKALTLRVVDADKFATLARDAKGTVSGKGEKPIIDIVGARVFETFGDRETVLVNYSKNRIVITR